MTQFHNYIFPVEFLKTEEKFSCEGSLLLSKRQLRGLKTTVHRGGPSDSVGRYGGGS